MQFLKSLDQITPADADRVGSKAYHCAQLKQAGFPVPTGVAVTTAAMTASAVFSEIESWLIPWPHEMLWAVRSSALKEDREGHSFAGLHETRLNVTREDVAAAVRACWTSVTSPRAQAYRRAQGLATTPLQTGVLIQQMIQPIAAGVAFTRNPITGAADEMILNAVWGFGEALVGGYVEPDEFRVRKADGMLLASQVGRKQYRLLPQPGRSRLITTDACERIKPALNLAQVCELTALLLRIEAYFKAPQDVEWCYDGSHFWIVQSRPITGIRSHPKDEIEWTRANVREVLPDLTSPQALCFLCTLLDRGIRRYHGHLLAPESVLGPMVKIFFGRLYFNLSQFRHLCHVSGMAPAAVLRAIGHDGDIRPEDELAPRPPLGPFLRALPDLLRQVWMQVNLSRRLCRQFARIDDMVARLQGLALEHLSVAELWSHIQTQHAQSAEGLRLVLILTSAVLIDEMGLQRQRRRVGFAYERLVQPALAAGEKSISTQQAFDFLALAHQAREESQVRRYFLQDSDSWRDYREALQGTQFLTHFEQFLSTYGHRGLYETDWALLRYREDPMPLLLALRTQVQASKLTTPAAILRRQQREAAHAWAAFEATLSPWQRLTRRGSVWRRLRRLKQSYLWRERYRSESMRILAELRRLHLALARRFTESGWIERPDDYFWLTLDEISAGLADSHRTVDFRPLITQRKAEYETFRALAMPLRLHESELGIALRRAAATLPEVDANEWHGLCVSPGSVEGAVIILQEPTEIARMRPGAILVAPATDPSWTPLFTLAAGIIVEVGGMLSHASTLAREYGLPALANVKDATRLLREGERVRLEATQGVVKRLSSPSPPPPATASVRSPP